MTKLSKSVVVLIVSMAGAGAITGQFLTEKEGNKTSAYKDGGGMWTICKGITRVNNKPVYPGMKLSEKECAKLNEIEEKKAEKWVENNVKIKLSQPQIAAVASFCYWNIGVTKCKKSTFWRKLNAGDVKGACRAINDWIYDGGRDCRIRSNNCYGQVLRRQQESELLCWGLK